LALVGDTILAHGGAYHLESREHKGTRITLSLLLAIYKEVVDVDEE
jgi:hypothetical protein